MSLYFFDSSAIIKRYVAETGTAWLLDIIDLATNNRLYLARITFVEVISALTRRAHSGSFSVAEASSAITQFRHDIINDYVAVDITPALIERATQLAEVHALRGYDAVQLAAALNINAYNSALGMQNLTLISADAALNAAAAAEGLSVDDPNAHT